MRQRRFGAAARNILIPLILVALLLGVVLTGIVLLAARATPHLNPIESVALRIRLAVRGNDLNLPLGNDPTTVCFTVSSGETAATIAARLAGQGFSLDPELFRTYVRYYALDNQLQAGTFSLQRTLTLPQLAQKLTNAGADTITFRIIEGWRLEEIAAQIDATPGFTYRGADFLAAVGLGAGTQGGLVGEFATQMGIPIGKPLEGFMFPDTYSLPACGTVEDLLARVLNNFETQVPPELRSAAAQIGYTFYDAVTLASIVQREAIFDDEKPLIAGVYLNRLFGRVDGLPNANVPRTLDADPTIQYAIGNSRDPQTWWVRITADDYRSVISPFNTYINPGLPPTPINSPGLAAIRAALFPETSGFVYFRACADGGGRHTFSRSFDEHLVACQ